MDSDLAILDYLELYNSTVGCAQALGLSQSSCSRRYRAFSDQLGLEFDRVDGRYQCMANKDVVAGLRLAYQKLRLSRLRLRLCLGWQLGALEPSHWDGLGVPMGLRPMDSWKLLSLLEKRLVDVAVMGLLEFDRLMQNKTSSRGTKRIPLSATMLCIPTCEWSLHLLSHQDHPLQGYGDTAQDDLAQYPSPSLPIGMAPVLMAALQNHGLASVPCGLSSYEEARWEGTASDGISLSYGAPHQLEGLRERYQLVPLPYDLQIRECLGVVGHRDVLVDGRFPAYLKTLLLQLHALLGPERPGLQWLA